MQSDSITFSQPIIKGSLYKKMLPKDCALVLEGGGIRGFYSAGVFEAFMDAGIMFPYIIGVSAGAANALSYISGQRGRNRIIVEKYVKDTNYLSYRNLLKHGSLFGYDFIFKTIPQKHIYWDKDMFDTHDIRFLSGTTDCKTGSPVWFDKQKIASGFDVVRASCSVPIVSKIVKYNGYDLLDGGISSPIPIEKSIADGNKFHVIVLTRNQGYVKTAFKHKSILKLYYRKYPRLIDAMMHRHIVYNKQIAICEQLVKEKKAIIIRPQLPLTVGRTAKDVEKVLRLYDEGHEEGKSAVELLNETFSLC